MVLGRTHWVDIILVVINLRSNPIYIVLVAEYKKLSLEEIMAYLFSNSDLRTKRFDFLVLLRVFWLINSLFSLLEVCAFIYSIIITRPLKKKMQLKSMIENFRSKIMNCNSPKQLPIMLLCLIIYFFHKKKNATKIMIESFHWKIMSCNSPKLLPIYSSMYYFF